MPLEPRPGGKVVPASSLRAKSQVVSAKSRPAEVRAPRKGPAFWSKSSPQLRRELPRAPSRPSWALHERIPGPPEFLGISSWWQISALLLVALSLALFCTQIILIYNSLTCSSCKGRWMQWGDSCYLHTSEPMPWRDCLSHCKSLKSSLLTGRTKGEMEFLLLQTADWFMMHNNRLRGGSYWVGLIYNTSENIWKWADGTNLHIWVTGAWQNISTPVDICVAISKGDSSSYECSNEYQCLCKKSVE
ncbi:natural killer cells antigen CD94-like [Lacerta agilis]|uniref:natural killer cells antigen CD94-like n=1 Tax=Lacerta agilis TaxID=80427 RepID=UPI0014194581|nr:natural killer cells antigen CD94-like [Lacerta agilis]